MKRRNLTRRRDRIIDLLASYGELSAHALSEMLEVSVQTIRADLRGLDEQSVVQRRNGSARLRQPSENIGYSPRLSLAGEEKRAIAATVAGMIPDGARVALGTGTTVQEVAHALTAREGLFVVTNNIHALIALQPAKDVVIALAGGTVRMRDLDVIGADSGRFFAKYRVDYAVFSCGGISERGEVLDYNDEEIATRQAIAECAKQTLLVADSGKFGLDLPCRFGMLWNYDRVVTGAEIPPEFSSRCSEFGCELRIPDRAI